MLVSCSDRGHRLFSSMEKEKSLIIYIATLDHSLNFSWVYLWSVHFHPDWVSSASVSIYKVCGLTAGSSIDLAIDSQWCEGLKVEKAEQSRHGSSICAVIQTLAFTLALGRSLDGKNRNNHYSSKSKLALLKQVSYWVWIVRLTSAENNGAKEDDVHVSGRSDLKQPCI